jgi:DNA polymerase phi
VLDLVCVLANNVPWLRQECGLLLCDAVKGLSAEIINSTRFLEPVLDKLAVHKLVRTPEGVAVWLTVRSSFPEFDEYPMKVWKNNNPLHPLERASLAKVMRENYVQDEGEDKNANAKNTGSWQQSLHFAWIVVFDKAIEYAEKEDPSGEPNEDTFKDIWIELADSPCSQEHSFSCQQAAYAILY